MPPYHAQNDWIITGQRAAELHGNALFLNARVRTMHAYRKQHVAGAVPAYWSHFSEPNDPLRGLLLEDRMLLQSRLRDVGVRADQPVVVVGDPIGGWGEDGRIVWMLRALGHRTAALVDGGQAALVAAGLLMQSGDPDSVAAGDFEISENNGLSSTASEMRALLASKPADLSLVDTREPGEFTGATPYGELRGGHVPLAVHLYFKEMLNTTGRLLPKEQLLALLAARGVTPNKRVIAYCTGGVRSGWFVAVLADMGFSRVANYAGSMWEWSSLNEFEYPLVTTAP
jgi:thiosulfate/3-mercaptopyruvate sulfurtransferase